MLLPLPSHVDRSKSLPTHAPVNCPLIQVAEMSGLSVRRSLWGVRDAVTKRTVSAIQMREGNKECAAPMRMDTERNQGFLRHASHAARLREIRVGPGLRKGFNDKQGFRPMGSMSEGDGHSRQSTQNLQGCCRMLHMVAMVDGSTCPKCIYTGAARSRVR